MRSAAADDRFLDRAPATATRLIFSSVDKQLLLESAHFTLTVNIRLDGGSSGFHRFPEDTYDRFMQFLPFPVV